MKSSIKIDFSESEKQKGLLPIIAVNLIETDDPRDKLVKSFFEILGGQSSWLEVCILNDRQIEIFPIAPKGFSDLITDVAKRCSIPPLTVEEFTKLPFEVLTRHRYFDQMLRTGPDTYELTFTLPEEYKVGSKYKFLNCELSDKKFTFTKRLSNN